MLKPVNQILLLRCETEAGVAITPIFFIWGRPLLSRDLVTISHFFFNPSHCRSQNIVKHKKLGVNGNTMVSCMHQAWPSIKTGLQMPVTVYKPHLRFMNYFSPERKSAAYIWKLTVLSQSNFMTLLWLFEHFQNAKNCVHYFLSTRYLN